MNVHSDYPFYITISNVGKAHVHMPKHQNDDEVANDPE